MSTVTLTTEQERAMNALKSGAYIHPNGRMFTKNHTYFRELGSRSFVGMIKKGVIKLVEHETYDGVENVWIEA